jgi:benzoate membrane transport protein
MFEVPSGDRPGPIETLLNLRGHHLVNAVVAFLFAATGPVALILTIGLKGGLSADDLASWIFIGFAGGGALTLIISHIYRQPLAFAWTISGTAIVGPALLKYPYTEVVGAYMATGVLMIVLGLSGGFKRLMDVTPVPIVMAMVAGVFLKFGVLAVDAFDKALWIALSATGAFVVCSFSARVARFVPPVLVALAAGAAVAIYTDQFQLTEPIRDWLAQPKYFRPEFGKASLIELVLPLAISVLALQNAQGIAILRVEHHDPPSNTITFVCGAGSLLFGAYGAVNTCLTGPVNAILASSGKPRFHFVGAYFWALLAIAFGLTAPLVTKVALAVPEAFIYILGGLAMLGVLRQAFVASFSGRFTFGALVTFVITITDLIPGINVNMLGIGAPFWGLVFGFATSLLLERHDFVAERAPEPEPEPLKALPPPSDAIVEEVEEAEVAAAKAAADEAAEHVPLTVVSPSPSPHTYRVLIALKEKRLPYRFVEDMTWQAGQGVSENPLSRNPLLKIGDDESYFDPRVILDYLETLRPEPPLMPDDPDEAFAVRRWEVLAEGVSGIVIDLYIEGARPYPFESEEWVRRQQTRVVDTIATIADMLGDRQYCVGDRFTRADIALVTTLDHLDLQFPTFDWRRAYGNLTLYFSRMRDRASVRAVLGEY